MRKIVGVSGLSKKQLEQIRMLDDDCAAHEPLFTKLNWDMLETRPGDEVNDLLCYEQDTLVGFFGLYRIEKNNPEIEMTGMVRPDCRRQGIFTDLYREAVSLCHSRGIKRLLLVTERRSESGKLFAENVDLSYAYSEFRMRCKAYQPLSGGDITLRQATDRDISFLADMDTTCFGSVFPGDYQCELVHLYIAVANGIDIGKIGLTHDGGFAYIFGVAILPQYRGRGYGRAMLGAILKRHFSSASSPVILEVATKNDTALALYRSVGFETVTIYDYYERML